MAPEANSEELELAEVLYSNGINGSTGEYLTPPMSGGELAKYIAGENPKKDVEYFDTLDAKSEQEESTYGLAFGLDCRKIDETGWGVVYAPGITDEIKEALKPLIDWRKEQAGPLFQEYEYFGETSRDFLVDHDTSIVGPAEPEEMPYYLLLVGSPGEIAYNFQYEMDVDRAIGRIHFDSAEEYHNYAQSVVAAEKGEVRLPRRAGFFGVANPNDVATQLSTDLLIEPLFQDFKAKLEGRDLGWDVKPYLREDAKRAQLERLLGGNAEETPAFLFTASHGMGFDIDDTRMLAHQGALLCQDWDGQRGRLPEDVYFAGEHIGDEARLHGLIGFFFACYGAGTPQVDEFFKKVEGQPRQIAPHPFLAGLPRRMLSHPRGGALAVVGHIERAWTYSFKWVGKATAHRGAFDSTLSMLFENYPIGAAFDFFNERHAAAAVQLNSLLERKRKRLQVSDVEVVRWWTVNNDARDYIILGDPAVRLCVPATVEEEVKPSTIELNRVDIRAYQPGGVELSQPAAATGGLEAAPEAESDAMTNVGTEAEAMALDMAAAGASLREATRRLASVINRAAANLGTLEVLTYLSDEELENVYDQGGKQFRDQAKLKAVTLISLDGGIKSVVPARTVETPGEEGKRTLTVEVDERLLALHRDMVDLAQANRSTFLKNLAEVAVSLVNTRL